MQHAHKLGWITSVAGLAVLLYFVPLFHVVPLKAARVQTAAALFDAVAFVDKFWQGPLLEASEHAPDASELLTTLQQDPSAAATRFGHRLGLSGSVSYFVSGLGRIVAVDNDTVSIALQEGGPVAVVIETGPVFGNAIRDGAGLLDISDFSNTQDFNAISSEINRRVEENVLPLLQANAVTGATVRFTGAVEVADSEGAPASLNLVPVVIEFP